MSTKRIIVLLLSLLLVAVGFSSCGDKYSDGELIEAAKPLVEKSVTINDIFYGDGIPYAIGNIGNGAQSTGNYAPADPLYLDKIGVKSIEDLNKLTSEVYSTGVCRVIFSTKLSSVSDGSSIAGYAEYVELPAGFCVYTKRTDYIGAKTTFHTDTLSVVSAKKDKATLKMNVTLVKGEKFQEREKEFSMIKEDGEWKLDSMTYIAWDGEAPSATLGAQ